MYSCTDGDRVPQISRGRGRLASESMQTLDLMGYAMTSPSHMGLNDYDKRDHQAPPAGGLSVFDGFYHQPGHGGLLYPMLVGLSPPGALKIVSEIRPLSTNR